jgi:hypothetical protein
MVDQIIDLETAILAATAGRRPHPRWAGKSSARAFTEKVRLLTRHLMTETDDPLPLFLRIIDADPHWRHHLAGRQRPETRIETLSWQWRFLLMIAIERELNSKR